MLQEESEVTVARGGEKAAPRAAGEVELSIRGLRGHACTAHRPPSVRKTEVKQGMEPEAGGTDPHTHQRCAVPREGRRSRSGKGKRTGERRDAVGKVTGDLDRDAVALTI